MLGSESGVMAMLGNVVNVASANVLIVQRSAFEGRIKYIPTH
jgi:hypothetical protein